jgi:hypothetical protein
VKDGLVVHNNPLHSLHLRRLEDYLGKRDGYHPQAPRWRGISCRWAGSLKQPGGRSTQAALNRILWDKTWIGRNRLKETGAADTAGCCSLCGATLEDQGHVVLTCCVLVKARRLARESVFLTFHALPRWVRETLDHYVRQCDRLEGLSWWTQMFSQDEWTSITGSAAAAIARQGTGSAARVFRNSMKKLGTAFHAGLLSIYRERIRLLEPPAPHLRGRRQAGDLRATAYTPRIDTVFRPLPKCTRTKSVRAGLRDPLRLSGMHTMAAVVPEPAGPSARTAVPPVRIQTAPSRHPSESARKKRNCSSGHLLAARRVWQRRAPSTLVKLRPLQRALKLTKAARPLHRRVLGAVPMHLLARYFARRRKILREEEPAFKQRGTGSQRLLLAWKGRKAAAWGRVLRTLLVARRTLAHSRDPEDPS